MNKISRNDLCPCGSGRKYKKCCIDKVLSFPNQSNFEGGELKDARGLLEMVKDDFSNKEFSSLEDMNSWLSTFYQNQNSLPKRPFLGLSPTQMNKVLNTPFSLDNELFKVETPTDAEVLSIPILKQALFFLNKLSAVGGLKGTQKGNLPKAFVIELYEKFFTDQRYARKPNREDDLPEATRLKHLLDISGLIKKRHNKFSLTQKGTSILENKKVSELFDILFINFANKWNWGYSDSYPELCLIQRSVAFNFLLILKKCKYWTHDKELGSFYLDAFPALIKEAPPRPYSTSEDQITNCFSIRFLSRFCVPMGILEYKNEKIKKEKYFTYREYYKLTPFFEKNFKFKNI